MAADTRTEEQELVDGLLQVTTARGMGDILNASPLLAPPKIMAMAMASFVRLMDLEQRLRWFERDMDRRFFELEGKLKG